MTKLEKEKIKKFKLKLMGEDGRTLSWFHSRYLKTAIPRYNYFIFQLNDHMEGDMNPEIMKAIVKYLGE